MSDRDRPLHGFSMAHATTHLNTNFSTTSTLKTKPDLSLTNSTQQQQQSSPQSQSQQHSPQQQSRIAMSTSSDNSKTSASTAASSSAVLPKTPSTPLGRVVDAGQEHTGRWTREEHEAFLAGLQQYGKEWKKVAAKVKTRTVVQTRTHAQKYFQKIQKGLVIGDDGKNEIDMSLIESKKVGSAKKKSARQRQQQERQQQQQLERQQQETQKKLLQQQQQQEGQQQQQQQVVVQQHQRVFPGTNFSSTTQNQNRQATVSLNKQAAVQLMAMSKTLSQNEDTIMNANANVNKPPPPSSSNFFSATDQATLASFSRKPQAYQHPHLQNKQQHQQQAQAQVLALGQQQIRFNTNNFGNVSFSTNNIPQTMTIVPPKPEQTMKKNIFPEPSPAACGSRKTIELAAARMLAAVANNKAGGTTNSDDFSGKTTPPLPSSNSPTINSIKDNTNGSNTNDGHTNQSHQNGGGSDGGGGGTKRPAPSAPGRLQIVNPESLGVMNEPKRRNLGTEPTTPWDGQLEALGSEVKNKEPVITAGPTVTATTTVTSIFKEEEKEYIDHPLHESQIGDRSALHTAVCGGSLQEVKHLINTLKIEISGGVVSNEEQIKILNSVDSDGFCPLHSAVSLNPSNMSVVMTHLLLSFGADAAANDRFGNSPLHWSARAGNDEVAQILVLKNCSPDIQNHDGETALHWAMRAGKIGLGVVRVLIENGARASLCNNAFQRPIDLAVYGFDDVCQENETTDTGQKTINKKGMDSNESIDAKRQTRMNMLCLSPQSRTLVLHHPECLEHVPKSESDWEAPDRVNSIMKLMGSNVRDYEVQLSMDFDKASLELLSRVHSAEYLTFVNDLSKELEKRRKEQIDQDNLDDPTASKKDAPVVPFTPMVQRTMRRETAIKKGSHSDTSFSSGSLRAARRAAGAVQHAVDCVLVGRNRNAFCVVRPPGHHAGINGLLAGGESCGFCIFNNVAAGAMHALSDEGHRPKCERCAIVDIDAHHGNGTEEIVKKCDDPGRLFFFSVHVYDNDKRKGKQNGFKFYPGTGEEDDVAHNIVNVPIAPMWREKELNQSTKPSQINYGEGRNTRNKTKLKAAAAASASKDANANESENLINDDTVNGASSHRLKSPKPPTPRSTPPHYFQGTGREAYRRAIQQRLLPALRAFNPDLIIISIGFDASKGDVGNARHYAGGKEAAGINLEPEDYAWTTSRIIEIADICCQGRVVSVLEGGYGRTPVISNNGAASSDNETDEGGNKLDKTVFSECAIRHLRAMIDPFDEEKLHQPKN